MMIRSHHPTGEPMSMKPATANEPVVLKSIVLCSLMIMTSFVSFIDTELSSTDESILEKSIISHTSVNTTSNDNRYSFGTLDNWEIDSNDETFFVEDMTKDRNNVIYVGYAYDRGITLPNGTHIESNLTAGNYKAGLMVIFDENQEPIKHIFFGGDGCGNSGCDQHDRSSIQSVAALPNGGFSIIDTFGYHVYW